MSYQELLDSKCARVLKAPPGCGALHKLKESFPNRVHMLWAIEILTMPDIPDIPEEDLLVVTNCEKLEDRMAIDDVFTFLREIHSDVLFSMTVDSDEPTEFEAACEDQYGCTKTLFMSQQELING